MANTIPERTDIPTNFSHELFEQNVPRWIGGAIE